MVSDGHNRRSAVLRFAIVHIMLSVVGLPSVIMMFKINIVEPNTYMAFALAVLVAGVLVTVLNTTAYSVGLSRSARRFHLRKRKLRVCSALCSLGALLLVPLLMAVTEVVSEHLPSGWQRAFLRIGLVTVPMSAMLASGILGTIVGRACKKPDQGVFCLRCGYNLTGNLSGACPECGRATCDGECTTTPNGKT